VHLLRAVETTFDFCRVFREHLAEHKILQDVLCSYGHSIFFVKVWLVLKLFRGKKKKVRLLLTLSKAHK
jgi:hypothetical protein